MNEHRSPNIRKPSSVKQLVILMALVSFMSACQSQEGSPTYPNLSTVSSPSDTSNPLEERRQIVRDLIEDRDVARHRKAVIRHRSGLSDVPPPAAPLSTKAQAEDIIRSAPAEGRGTASEGFDEQSERIYRDRAQFDDGTLDDFIRRLKQDTAPPADDEPVVDGGAATGEVEEPKPQSWQFQGELNKNYALAAPDLGRPIVLSAFAPAAMQNDEPVAILLAASEDDRGFWCTYLGWAVAWSNACLDEEGSAGSKDEEVAAVEDGEAADQESSTQSQDLAVDQEDPGSGGEDVADPNQSGAGDEITASEDIGDEGLLPVTSTLDRLRNLIRSRTRRPEGASTDRKSLSYEAPELQSPAEEGPPLPSSRPEVEKDLRIVRNDHLFEFERTPRPAFKPLPPEPKTVIFPPEKARSNRDVEFVPAARPSAPVAEKSVIDDEREAAQLERQQELAAVRDLDQAKIGQPEDQAPAATLGPSEPDDALLIDSELILFDSGSAKLPAGIETRLRMMLDNAKAENGKLFIVSEASVGNLAMERARSVGLALVRLGATADLIEYDIVVDRSADHVQLLLKEVGNQSQSESAAGELDKVK